MLPVPRIYSPGFAKAQAINVVPGQVVTFDMTNRLVGFFKPKMSLAGSMTLVLPTTKCIIGAMVLMYFTADVVMTVIVKSGSLGGPTIVVAGQDVNFNLVFFGDHWEEFGQA